jgi:beta-lactam-binding protein with PASTA domain
VAKSVPRSRPRARPRGLGVLRLLVVLALLGVLAVATVFAVRAYFEVGETQLPDVVGLPRDEAVRVLRGLGLTPVTFTETSNAVPVGTVTSQSPSPGTAVREGRGISLGVNEAVGLARVPELTGNTEVQARVVLQDLGLELGEVSYVFSDAPQGQVLSQVPAPAENVSPGSSVSVVLSRGPDIATRPVPDLREMQIDAAKARLEALGFTNLDTLASSVSFDRPFHVTDQLPEPGESVPVSTRVTLYYSLSTDTVVEVPAVTGMSLGQAQLALRGAGLTLGGFSYVEDPEQHGGVVAYEPMGFTLRETPVTVTVNRLGAPVAGGPDDPLLTDEEFPSPDGLSATDPLPLGTPVELAPPGVAETGGEPGAPAANQRTIQFDFDPRQLGGTHLQDANYKLTLVVRDERGERTVLDEVVAAGQPVSTRVEVYGEALLQTFLNDIFFQAWNP